MSTVAGTEWLLPEAPKYHEEERKCQKCGYPLNSYTLERGYGEETYLICNPCNEERLRRGKTLREFVGYEKAKKKHPNSGVHLTNLEALRNEKGWTQAKLGRESGVTEDTIGVLERQKRTARPETIKALAKALGCSADALTRRS